jgi:hypothetical protein
VWVACVFVNVTSVTTNENSCFAKALPSSVRHGWSSARASQLDWTAAQR